MLRPWAIHTATDLDDAALTTVLIPAFANYRRVQQAQRSSDQSQCLVLMRPVDVCASPSEPAAGISVFYHFVDRRLLESGYGRGSEGAQLV